MSSPQGNRKALPGDDRARRAGRGAKLLAPAALALLCSLIAVVLSVPALAAPSEFEFRGAFGPDGTEATEFELAGSVAVDQAADVVYATDALSGAGAGSLYKFDLDGNAVPFAALSGNEISGLTFNPGEANSQVAVDPNSGRFYVTSGNSVTAFQPNGEPADFSAGPGAGTNAIGGFTRLIGLAVDAEGAIYAADRDAGGLAVGVVKVFAPTGEEITQFSAPEAGNLAVDSSGAVYVNRRFNVSTVLKYTPSVFPVTGATTYTAASQPFSPKATYTVAVDRTTDEVYLSETAFASGDQAPRINVHAADGTLLTSFAGPGEDGELERPHGLAVHEVTGRVFVANDEGISNTEDPNQVRIFGPRTFFEGPPTVVSTSVADVTADSLTFIARINPNTADTTYRIEYGLGDCALTACASVPLGEGQIAAGHDPVTVSHSVTGLQAGTTYHYRVVADNSVEGDPKYGLTESPDRTFTTQVSGLGFQLPDNRAWEMVSPPDKHGARIAAGSSSGHVQAAADGEGLAYQSNGSITGEPQGLRESSAVLSRRGAGGRWSSEDITTPNESPAPPKFGFQGEYELFDPDLSAALVDQATATPLSPEASGETIYLRQNTQPPSYRPLLTDKEGFANVPPGTKTGGTEVKAATPDLDSVVLQSGEPLSPGAPAGGLYRWRDGQVEPVSILPGGEGGGTVGGSVGSSPNSIRHALSDDGSRLFWTAPSTSGLYMRELDAGETVRIDVKTDGSGAGAVDPVFQGASADGSVVFFTDTQQLTADASPEGDDLYRCELALGGPLSGCSSLTNLTAPRTAPGESAEVQGMAPALGDDGTVAYFVAKGVLDTEGNQSGASAQLGEPNLYRWQDGEGVRFVATLSLEDIANWGIAGIAAPPGMVAMVSAAGSPSGRYLAFMSRRSLAGEDNLDAASGEPVQRVFRYDAVADSLQCVSCDPTGAAPTGSVFTEVFERLLIDPRQAWSGSLLAAVLPQSTANSAATDADSFYRPRAVHDNGRVFFNAVDSLVPADSNGQWDVYQYEPSGVGSCDASSGGAATSRSGEGCVSLISSGSAEEAAGFYDASAEGKDVFFWTPAQLSVLDEDREPDIYDARVNGIAARLEPNTECLGEACQPAAVAPGDPTPASASFRGDGNVEQSGRKRCAKGKRAVRRNGRARCVPRKKKNAKRANRRAAKHRRAGR